MSLSLGIVGLPNVGKSSLFNALTKANAQASNFPFTTIEPNVGVVAVPDDRLKYLTKLYSSERTIPVTIEFVDIAGLVKGASKGEGLGNKFLTHIRNIDAIVEVVRCFEDPSVSHVHGEINPSDDMETINTELLLADLQQADKSLSHLNERGKKGDKEAIILKPRLEEALKLFGDGLPLRTNPELVSSLRQFQFLTAKPLLYVANVSEKLNPSLIRLIENKAANEGARVIAISVKTELEVVGLSDDEQIEYRQELGLKSGLDEVIRAGYELLDLITFFTAGPKDSHGWTITRGTKAPQAAGKIHTDFEKGFIRAEVFNVKDLQDLGSEKAVREKGKLRSEGKAYTMQDGDVAEFLFGS